MAVFAYLFEFVTISFSSSRDVPNAPLLKYVPPALDEGFQRTVKEFKCKLPILTSVPV
jgi:hypothetical protein